MFLPGMRLFRSWKEAERGTAWDTLLMIGSVTSLGAVSASSGLATWLVAGSLGGIDTWSTGRNPALYALPVVFTASCAFLLPLDAVPLVTYGKGYYRMFDMFLPGAVISVV